MKKQKKNGKWKLEKYKCYEMHEVKQSACNVKSSGSVKYLRNSLLLYFHDWNFQTNIHVVVFYLASKVIRMLHCAREPESIL